MKIYITGPYYNLSYTFSLTDVKIKTIIVKTLFFQTCYDKQS